MEMSERLESWEARAKLKLSQFRSDYSRDPETVESIDEGALRWEGFYENELIDEVREQLRSKLEDDETGVVKERDGVEVYRDAPFDPEEIEGIDEILSRQKIREKVRHYFGSDFDLAYTRVLRYEHVPGEESRAGSPDWQTRKWHLDTSADNNTVRFLVFLTDQEDSGALKIVGQEQTRELISQYGYGKLEKNPKLVRENSNIQEFGGKRGTALLFNPVDQLHRGSNPSKGSKREVVIFSFLPRWRR